MAKEQKPKSSAPGRTYQQWYEENKDNVVHCECGERWYVVDAEMVGSGEGYCGGCGMWIRP